MKFTNIFSADDLNPSEGMTNKKVRQETTIEEAIKFEYLLTND